jgi:L-lysine exporter family protein LysE/ArgO
MFFQGFILALSLITSVGPQNTFALKQGLNKNYLFATAFSASIFNSLSISAGILGLGRFLTHYPAVKTFMIWAGVVFLSLFALRSFFLVFKGQHLDLQNKKQLSLRKTLFQSMLFAWANPLTLLESFFLLGSISSQYCFENALLFGAGCVLSTFVWFFFITYGASLFHAYAKHPRTWRIINFVTGCICSGAAYALFKRSFGGC